MYTFRKLTKEDAEQYWNLRLEGLKNHPDAFGHSFDDEQQTPLREVQEGLEGEPDSDEVWLGMFDGDTLFGFGQVKPYELSRESHKAMISAVYVSPEYRGGTGRALMEALIDEAKKLPDVEQVILAVLSGNEAAQSLYESLGFEVYAEDPDSVKLEDGTYRDDIWMKKYV
ncbi:GNAT family N-acetyltransferase [Exiguobacterium acetylicum]|uniref:GNAT family N-acetyltransferase n=1 Tax=Exiguobacterium acetylicum TaxID=41170 RepID=UPI001EE347F3|nr:MULTISPECIES: GNAT family N-acetyltransferase [Exiguobacterium]MCY1691901.1 GNAT family N-acetyltransferase [Exiguobacterium sp. SL14]UKS56927.1 GNAT family N-acetyltransferase [Exiguobacterium acetylicum]